MMGLANRVHVSQRKASSFFFGGQGGSRLSLTQRTRETGREPLHLVILTQEPERTAVLFSPPIEARKKKPIPHFRHPRHAPRVFASRSHPHTLSLSSVGRYCRSTRGCVRAQPFGIWIYLFSEAATQRSFMRYVYATQDPPVF